MVVNNLPLPQPQSAHILCIPHQTKLKIMSSLIKITTVAASLVLTPLAFASQADIDAELGEYLRVFQSDNFQEQRRAIDKLSWAGYRSTEFYDVIAERLISLQDSKDKESKEKASWYAKSLALSGDPKYQVILQNVAANTKVKKIRKYAELALKRFDKHQRWNPIISQGLVSAPTGRLEEARVKNMLSSSDHSLLRIGAKRVYHAHKSDAELISVAKQRLAAEYLLASEENDDQVDAIAWLIKVMAETGNRENRALLEKIAEESTVKKVKKYALKYAEYLN